MPTTAPQEQLILDADQVEAASASHCKLRGVILMEFRPRHNICTLSLRVPEVHENVQVRLGPNQVQLYSVDRNEWIRFQMPPLFTFDLTKLDQFDTDHTWTRSEDGMLSLVCNTSSGAAIIKCRLLNPPATPVPGLLRDEFGQVAHRVHDIRCQRCSTSMLKKSVLFKRILPLPAGGFSTSGIDFFCHPVQGDEDDRRGHAHIGEASTTPDFRKALGDAADAEEAALAEEDGAKAVAALQIMETAVAVATAAAEGRPTNSSPLSTVANDKLDRETMLEDETVTIKQPHVESIAGNTNRGCTLLPSGGVAFEKRMFNDLKVAEENIAKSLCREVKQPDPMNSTNPPEQMPCEIGQPEPLTNVKQELATRDATELLFTVSKFIIDEEILSVEVKKLGDSILCPHCKVIVGMAMPSENARKRVSFYRVRVSLDNPETREVIARLNNYQLVARLVRQLIAYKFQVRLFLVSESSPDVLVLWVMESDVFVYDNKIFSDVEAQDREIQFKKKHKVLFTKALRNSSYVQHHANKVEVLRESVLQDTLDQIFEHLIASTTSKCFLDDELHFDGYQVGYIDTLG